MSATLNAIVDSNREVKESLSSINKGIAFLVSKSANKKEEKNEEEQTRLLTQILNTQKQQLFQDKREERARNNAARRESQIRRRKEGDTLRKVMGRDKKEKKEQGKGFLDGLLGMLGGMLSGIGIPTLLGALGIGAIGAAILGYFQSSQFRNFVNGLVGPLLTTVVEQLEKGLQRALPQITNGVVQYKPNSAQTTENIPVSRNEVLATNDFAKQILRQGIKDGNLDQTEQDFLRKGMINLEEIDKRQQRIAKQESEIDSRVQWIETLEKEILDERSKARPNQGLIVAKQDSIKRFNTEIKQHEQTIRTLEVEIKSLLTIEHNGVQNNKLMLVLINETRKLRADQNNRPAPEVLTMDSFKQKGGPVRVPGSGSGDKVPMMLPPGSFVLNRNAAGFQNGGLVPTMLEPGESVYGPGTWGPMEAMMNSMIPRFQTGGMVEADHPQTGSGWSIGPDYKGRPSIFTKEAAESLLKAMKDSGGVVKTSDIYSSRRSPSHNTAVGGVPNSNHLYGNAVDIHGPSKVWLKANGAQYGWHNLVYSGHDGHFDYRGGGAGLPVDGSGRETTARTTQSDVVAAEGAALEGFGVWGKLGELFNDMFGGLIGGLGDAIGGLLNPGQQAPGPGGSSPSEPLTGDTAAKAKKMFDYIVSKGYTAAQAKGIIANIQRESSFDLDAIGDGGSSHGLFQWHGGRATRMKAAVPDYATNWKGQIDYALNEHVGPQYQTATAGMSAKDAGYWWMNKWEIPADRVRGGDNHRKMNGFIDSYGFQKGGVVNMSGRASSSSDMMRFREAQETFLTSLAESAPIVVMSTQAPPPTTGGGGVMAPVSGEAVPTLPEDSSVVALLELQNRISMGRC